MLGLAGRSAPAITFAAVFAVDAVLRLVWQQ